MSKNFELLRNISHEKDLFQTLDGWEDTDESCVNVERAAEFEGTTRARSPHQSPLPDVFQSVNETFGPLDLVPADLSRDAETPQRPLAQWPIEEPSEQKAQVEAQSTVLEDRFPLSGNPVTPMNSALDLPQAWVKPEILSGLNQEVELELEPKTARPNMPVPETSPTPEKATGPNDRQVQERNSVKEKKIRPEPSRPRPFGTFGVDEGKSIGESRVRKGRGQSAYRDPSREAIAREEQLKLVQRIFLADQNSPRMVLFSGFERDTGCASICIRAGEILALQGEESVCLVDMGFRVPSLHEYCGVSNDRGLAAAIADSNPIQEFAKQLSPANLWVVPAGYDAPRLNFATVADRLRARMEELRKAFRYVVVHSGSLWLNADAMLISKWTDGVVLVLEAHSTRRDTARRIKESLAVANARVLGVVLNNRTYPIPETLYSRL